MNSVPTCDKNNARRECFESPAMSDGLFFRQGEFEGRSQIHAAAVNREFTVGGRKESIHGIAFQENMFSHRRTDSGKAARSFGHDDHQCADGNGGDRSDSGVYIHDLQS